MPKPERGRSDLIRRLGRGFRGLRRYVSTKLSVEADVKQILNHIWFLVLGVFAISSCSQQEKSNDVYYNTTEGRWSVPLDFSSPQMNRLKKDALLGSQDAISLVLQRYANCTLMHKGDLPRPEALPTINECSDELKYWKMIGLQNQTIESMSVEYNTLAEKPDCYSIYRSRFWLEKLLKSGLGEPWKSEMQRQELRERSCRW